MTPVRAALIGILLFTSQDFDMPCVRHLEAPQYSQIGRMARVQGEVVLQVIIAPDGTVRSVISQSGHPILRRDAEENVKKWVFTQGNERRIQISYGFRLEPPAVDYIPQSHVSFELPYRVVVSSHPPKTDH